MKSFKFPAGEVVVKLMSLRDVDGVLRDTRKLMENRSEEVATLIAYLIHGLESAWFPLTEESILDLDPDVAAEILERIQEVNSPLGKGRATP